MKPRSSKWPRGEKWLEHFHYRFYCGKNTSVDDRKEAALFVLKAASLLWLQVLPSCSKLNCLIISEVECSNIFCRRSRCRDDIFLRFFDFLLKMPHEKVPTCVFWVKRWWSDCRWMLYLTAEANPVITRCQNLPLCGLTNVFILYNLVVAPYGKMVLIPCVCQL